mmetsp:Transcript_19339/g.18473  ORF Transcript_19339/g.18473 Transcript_19339/m.18473 type:complete len:99 (+) Transcript_19339:98-394(+)
MAPRGRGDYQRERFGGNRNRRDDMVDAPRGGKTLHMGHRGEGRPMRGRGGFRGRGRRGGRFGGDSERRPKDKEALKDHLDKELNEYWVKGGVKDHGKG